MLFGSLSSSAILVTRFKEPAWHGQARRNRSVARKKLSAAHQAQQIPTKKFAKLVGLLESHHVSSVPAVAKQRLRTKTTMTSQVWWCRFCEVRMGIATTHCNHCNRHWKQTNYVMEKDRSKSKSKSRENPRSKSKAGTSPRTPGVVDKPEEETAMQMFAEKAPWIISTPRSRVDVESSGEAQPSTAVPTEAPTVKPLTEEQEQYKEQLLGRKKLRGSLPADLGKELQDLQPVMQMPILTHEHLNQLSKLEKTVSGIYKKMIDMDDQWQDFVAEANEKFSKHKNMYVQTRDQMLKDLREKNEELNRLKTEISTASEGLQPKALG